MAVAELPQGTVTFLFTDLELSTELWDAHPNDMGEALARHDALLRDAVRANGGHVVKGTGDGIHAVFVTAHAAVAGALDAQRAVANEDWGPTPLRVRMGIHTGETEHRDGDYFGGATNRAARLMSAANAGQVLVSHVTAELVLDRLGSAIEVRDLGEHRLRGLLRAERVFQVSERGSSSEFPPLRTAETPPGNLPMQGTAFVGRVREVDELVALVPDKTLVTLTGVGGVGKTRLALQVAAELAPSFRDGVWLVELGGVTSDDAVQDAVAAVLGLGAGAIPGGSGVEELLRAKQLLLVLDNCEHVLGAAAALVEGIVRTASGVHVLATSREGLGVAGEHLRSVPSLELPVAGADSHAVASSDAVQLFVERAREASAGYKLTDSDSGAVAELCRRLDGIPLAIELAAARVPSLTPAEIAELLDQRFRLLTGGRRAAVSRHHTLRNAIEWSYQLLEPEERVVLDRLAVFAGGFDVRSAQAVAADDTVDALDVIDIVGRLVSKSLVVAEPRGDRTRYRLLETVRDFAWEQLQNAGDSDRLGRRHAEHFGAFARDAGGGLRGPDEAIWRARIDEEVHNLRAGLGWAVAVRDVELALEPVSELAVLGDVAPYGRAAEDAARLAEDHRLAAVALAAASFAVVLQGDVETALRLGEEAHARAAALDRTLDNLWVRCRVANATCMTLSVVADGFGEFGDEWLADARELGDPWCLCEALTFVVAAADLDAGLALGDEALEVARSLHTPSRIVFTAALLGARFAERDPERADALFAEATAAMPAAAGNDWVDYVTSSALVPFYLTTGRRRAAAAVAVDAMERSMTRHVQGHVLLWVGTLASVLASEDRDGALLLMTWAEQRGLPGGAVTTILPHYDADVVIVDRSGWSTAELELVARQASTLTDVDVARFARERLDRLPADVPPAP